MNITSVIVAAGLMGLVAPGVANMAVQPVLAQRRATNFGEAEAAAVQFAATNEGQREVSEKVPKNCELDETEYRAYTVTCTVGKDKFEQIVARSFRLEVDAQYTNPSREFAWEKPPMYSHVECLPNDPWGVMWYNAHLQAGGLGACIPAPAWSEERYLASNPNDWLYDLTEHGYGRHPDY
jgi:hypothetical protein